jgi:hypothetical protein
MHNIKDLTMWAGCKTHQTSYLRRETKLGSKQFEVDTMHELCLSFFFFNFMGYIAVSERGVCDR